MKTANLKNQGELFSAEMLEQDKLFYEKQALSRGATTIAGIDEAGRGPLSGPVVAAAVILDPDISVEGIQDSKKLQAHERERLFTQILETAVSVGVGCIEPDVIDEINILQATYLAMKTAVDGLNVKPDHVLVDGYAIPDFSIPQTAIIKGDQLSISIGAASIVAKVVRDSMMVSLSRLYPQYGFDKNKGYATQYHRDAIQKHGPCMIHRLSFRGVKEYS